MAGVQITACPEVPESHISEFCGGHSTPHLHHHDTIQGDACDEGFTQINKSGMVTSTSYNEVSARVPRPLPSSTQNP